MPDDEDDEPPAPTATAPAPAALPPAAKPDDGWLSDFSDEEPGKKGKLPKKSKRKPGQRGAAAATSVPGPSKSLADELRDD